MRRTAADYRSGPVVWSGVIASTCLVLFLFQKMLWLVVPFILALIIYYALLPAKQKLVMRGISHDAAAGYVAALAFSVVIGIFVLGLPWIAAHAGKPWFLWTHFLDPHSQYVTHPGETSYGDSQEDIYDGEIHFTDKQLWQMATTNGACALGAQYEIGMLRPGFVADLGRRTATRAGNCALAHILTMIVIWVTLISGRFRLSPPATVIWLTVEGRGRTHAGFEHDGAARGGPHRSRRL